MLGKRNIIDNIKNSIARRLTISIGTPHRHVNINRIILKRRTNFGRHSRQHIYIRQRIAIIEAIIAQTLHTLWYCNLLQAGAVPKDTAVDDLERAWQRHTHHTTIPRKSIDTQMRYPLGDIHSRELLAKSKSSGTNLL